MASVSAEIASRNRLLSLAPPGTLQTLLPHLDPVEFNIGDVLVPRDEPLEFVHFVLDGIASVITMDAAGDQVETGNVGNEGMTGSSAILDVRCCPQMTFVQVPGSGLRVPVGAFMSVVEEDAEFRRLLLRYIHTLAYQTAQTAVMNARKSINERLARWLLMSHDRLGVADLPLRHHFLATMLGVRRSSVTEALHVIEGRGILRATRGNIRVVDRLRLEEVAGACYGGAEAEYERVIAGEIPCGQAGHNSQR